MRSHDPSFAVRNRERYDEINRRCYDSTTKTYTCYRIDCQKVCKNFRSMRRHLSCVHSSRDVVCDYTECNKLFKSEKQMRLHFKTVHTTDKPFKCPHNECGQQFTNKQRLDRHLDSHLSAGQPFVCEFIGCQKRYKNEMSLKTHKRIHLSEPTIKCTVEGCGQRFHEYKYMVKHRQTVHSVPRYIRRRPPAHCIPCQWPGCDFTAKSNT
ncbi:unnamed protein product, partial [Medioppia subpectinata]